jgi:hypothetical protein
MANPFSITAASDSVRLDFQGRGSMSFTVSNISGRARRPIIPKPKPKPKRRPRPSSQREGPMGSGGKANQ